MLIYKSLKREVIVWVPAYSNHYKIEMTFQVKRQEPLSHLLLLIDGLSQWLQ